MVRILDTPVRLEFPFGHHLHCLVAQLPIRLRRSEHGYTIDDPDRQWLAILTTLEVAAENKRLGKLHVALFPESAVPLHRLDDMIAAVGRHLRPNTVTIFGVEHVALRAYREFLERFREDNGAALALVEEDLESGASPQIPVNWCCIAVKETDGRLRVFLEAKSHPFRGEEFPDKVNDLYRGRHFYLFRSEPSCFNFLPLICFDYIYRDLLSSNIRQIIDHANHLFLTTRQRLDAVFVIQCNPKPEHRAYREVVTGFYGEYLEETPGVREAVTVLANCSDESTIDGYGGGGSFGVSSVILGRHHQLARFQDPEFRTDDFDGAPVYRLRFGAATRLYYFNLPAHHERDPRTGRTPVKVHLIMQPSQGGEWLEEVRIPWPAGAAPNGWPGVR